MNPEDAPLSVQIARDGNVIGSFPLERVDALVKAGSIRETDQYWHEGLNDWHDVRESWQAGAVQQADSSDKQDQQPLIVTPPRRRQKPFRMVMAIIAFFGVLLAFLLAINGASHSLNIGVIVTVVGIIGWALAALDDARDQK